MDQQKYQQRFFEILNQKGISPERAAWLICQLNSFLESGVKSQFSDNQFSPNREDTILPDVKEITTTPAQENVTQKITNFLTNLGFRSNLLGFDYLRNAITYCVANGTVSTTKELYPHIARKMSSTPSRVERAIRHSIGSAFERCPTKFTNFMGDSFLSTTPTNSEFIALVADRIRNNLL